MGLLRRHQRRRGRRVGEPEIDVHAEPVGHGREGGDDVVAVEAEAVQVELDTLEEHRVAAAGARVDVLFGVHDVAVVIGEELRGGRNDPRLVGAREEQHGGHGHRSTGVRARSRPPRSLRRR